MKWFHLLLTIGVSIAFACNSGGGGGGVNDDDDTTPPPANDDDDTGGCNVTGCPDGQSLINPDSPDCRCEDNPVEQPACAEGTHQVGDDCFPDVVCGDGTIQVGDECVPDATCGMGTVEVDGECIPEEEIHCGAGTYLHEEECLPSTLPPDMSGVYYLNTDGVGHDIWYRCDNGIRHDFVVSDVLVASYDEDGFLRLNNSPMYAVDTVDENKKIEWWSNPRMQPGIYPSGKFAEVGIRVSKSVEDDYLIDHICTGGWLAGFDGGEFPTKASISFHCYIYIQEDNGDKCYAGASLWYDLE